MKIEATRKDAYKLFHDGTRALADVEWNGVRVDTDYCKKQFKKIDKQIDNLRSTIYETKLVKKWKRIYGSNFKLDSNDQLASILFKHMGMEAKIKTATGKPSTKEEALAQMDVPAVKKVIEWRKLNRVRNKLDGIYRETVGEYMHPVFGLSFVKTYRGSSFNPNFQNMDIRNKETAKLVRRAIIAPKGFHILEVDYGGIEVSGAEWYHLDPVMHSYIEDPKKDMHYDMAMKCFKLSRKEIGSKKETPGKTIRYCGKNMFVFPQFYGDYFARCAQSLWNATTTFDLRTANKNLPLQKHLKKHDVRNYKSFENHIKGVEDWFWNKKFQQYGQWKNKHWKRYLKNGYVDLLTGFRCSGRLVKNEVVNYPVQGVAFHCLLWSLIRMNRWLKKNKMKSKIVGQIHDSMVLYVLPSELQDVLTALQRIMCVEIRKHWKFINTHLEIEAELSPVGATWYDKQEIEI